MSRILAIEDDRELTELLEEFFSAEGFEFHAVHNGIEGASEALSGDFDIVILDVMLPGMNGFDVLRKIRNDSRVPVIMLTAKGDDIDRIVGLEIGADDYLPKPFNTRELLARVRAVLRRYKETGVSGKNAGSDCYFSGDLKICPSSHRVSISNRDIDLTSIEFKLLNTLVMSAGHIIERQKLVQKVLDRPWSPFDRSIDVHMSNLRKKLGPHPDGTERIKTIRGEGYLYTVFSEGQED